MSWPRNHIALKLRCTGSVWHRTGPQASQETKQHTQGKELGSSGKGKLVWRQQTNAARQVLAEIIPVLRVLERPTGEFDHPSTKEIKKKHAERLWIAVILLGVATQ